MGLRAVSRIKFLLWRPQWCQRADLNRRPKAYESSALPLSYSGFHGRAERRNTRLACQALSPEFVTRVPENDFKSANNAANSAAGSS